MLKRLLTFLFFLVLAIQTDAIAQYTLTSWGVQDGLPQGSVRSVTQTKDGYLWVATWNGLARFDGVRFSSFHSGNTPELLSSSITTVFADSHGELWVGTDGGGALRYTKGVFTRLDSARGIPASRIMDINEDREGRVWICTEIGFYGVRNDSVLHFSKKDGLIRDYAGSVLPGPNGTLYLGMVDDVARVRIVDDSLIVEKTFPVGGIRLDVDDRGALWYHRPTKGIVRRVMDNEIIERRLSHLDPGDIFLTDDGRMWLATTKGLYIITGDRVELLKQVDGVNLDRVVVVFKDREGNIWLSTTGKGLLRLRPKYIESVSKATGFKSDYVMCGIQDRSGSIWIGTWDQGLFKMSAWNSSMQSIAVGAFRPFPLTTPPASVVEIKEFRDGTVWLGAWAYGAIRISGDRAERFTKGSMRENYSVTSIGEGQDGSVWLGTAHDGVFRYSGSHEEKWNTRRGLSSNEVSVVYCQRNGDVWVGTSGGGVNRISGDNVLVISRSDGLTDNFVTSILEDAEGTLWIATVRGLNRWKPATPGVPGAEGRLSAITQASGLYDDATNQLAEEGKDLWIGAIHGVYRVAKEELNAVADGLISTVHCFRLGKSDGMLSEECGVKGNSKTWKTRDGRLWFSTSGGAVSFDPRSFRTTASPPDVIIEEVSVENTPAQVEESIVLQPGQARLDVRYTGIDLSSPQSVRFRYTLEGFETEWNDAGRERTAHYTNIDPGSYVFRVTASNYTGVWNETGASMHVVVLPPFWATWWFRGGIVFFLAGSIVWTTRSIERRKAQRQLEAAEREAALERQRLRIARDLHDELGARLTEIGLMTDVARKERKAREKSGQLEEIAVTARGIVDSFREIVWTVSPQQDSLASLVDFLEQYAVRFLKKVGIRVRLEIPADLPNVTIRSEMRHGIFMVVKEALNNVAKHSRAREVTLTVQIEPTSASLTIEDNGRGFAEKDVQRITNGLTGMNKRLADIGGLVDITSVPKRGTKVVLKIPLNPSILRG